MTSKTANPYGLEFQPSNVGREADALAVAETVVMLRGGKALGMEHRYASARHAVALHVISGKLHRLAERQCNEDLTCRECDGTAVAQHGREQGTALAESSCRACAGTGNTLGRKKAKLEAGAKEIAAHYGLAVYFQGDPRGCSLYLIDKQAVLSGELGGFTGNDGRTPDEIFNRWIASNYNRGHAVVRLGR